jgi:hypothetical protein
MNRIILIATILLSLWGCSSNKSSSDSCKDLAGKAVKIMDEEFDSLISEYQRWQEGKSSWMNQGLANQNGAKSTEEIIQQIETFQRFLKEVRFTVRSGFASEYEFINEAMNSSPHKLNSEFPVTFVLPVCLERISRGPAIKIESEKVIGALTLLSLVGQTKEEEQDIDLYVTNYKSAVDRKLLQILGDLEHLKTRVDSEPELQQKLKGLRCPDGLLDGEFARSLGKVVQGAVFIELARVAGGRAELLYRNCALINEGGTDKYHESETFQSVLKTFRRSSVLEWPATSKSDIDHAYEELQFGEEIYAAWPTIVLTEIPDIWNSLLYRIQGMDDNTYEQRSWFFQLAYLRCGV